MGKDKAPSAKPICARDLKGVNHSARKLLRANAEAWKSARSEGARGEHWSTKTASVQVGEFSFLFKPSRTVVPGLFPPHFWTKSCISIRIVGINGYRSSELWTPKGSEIGQHRLWADCRKSLPEVKLQLEQLLLTMLAFANLERFQPTEISGTPLFLATGSELTGKRADQVPPSTPPTPTRTSTWPDLKHWG